MVLSVDEKSMNWMQKFMYQYRPLLFLLCMKTFKDPVDMTMAMTNFINPFGNLSAMALTSWLHQRGYQELPLWRESEAALTRMYLLLRPPFEEYQQS